MKYLLSLFSMFFFIQTVFSQTTKLSALSSATFTDSRVVFDENNEVYGYLFLFEKDKISKKLMKYELVLLDKNLNKVATLEYEQGLYTSMWVDFTSAIYYVKKQGDNLYFLVAQSYEGSEELMKELIRYKGVSALGVIDLKTFKLKEGFYSNFNEIVVGSPIYDMNKSAAEIMKDAEIYKMMKILNQGILVSDLSYQSELLSAFMNKPRKDHQKAYNFFDFNYKKLWTLKVNENVKSKSFFDYSYLKSNNKDIVFKKVFYEKRKDSNPDVTYLFVDILNGKQKFEINFSSTKEILEINDILFLDNQIIFIASVYDYDKKGVYSYNEKRGIARISFDRTTGKQITRNDLKWSDLSSKLQIDENGKIKEEGYIQFLEFKTLNDGKIIAVGEGYKPEKSTKILDLYGFVFSETFKVIDFLKVDKFKNKISNVDAYGNYLENIDAFDYMYSQDIENDNHLFFYSDNEKEGISAKRNPNWVLGIVSYIDGKFQTQKIPLTTKKGQINPIIAKKGYILLNETFKDKKDKDNELRLEKIDY